MKLHDLAPSPGSNRPKRRVGRGTGGKGGKTAGRGTKGQKARNKIKLGFEGGQLPLTQRIPKLRGFANPFRVEYNVVNLDVLDELEADEVTPDSLEGRRHRPSQGPGEGPRWRRAAPGRAGFRARLLAFGRRGGIEAAGGSVTVVPPPYGDRRPPAKGNALANR